MTREINRGEYMIGGRLDYHPIKFKEAMPEIDSGEPDVYQAIGEQARASAFRRGLLKFVGGATVITAAVSTTLGVSYMLGSVRNSEESARFNEFLKPDPLWRVPIGAGVEEILMTDQAGGVKAVDVRLLESKDPDKDIIGTTIPGCVVSVSRVTGPDYYALGEDDGRLPRVIINGVGYRTWLVGEFPLFELDKNDRWTPRLGRDGKQLVAHGYIAGMNATRTNSQAVGCESE